LPKTYWCNYALNTRTKAGDFLKQDKERSENFTFLHECFAGNRYLLRGLGVQFRGAFGRRSLLRRRLLDAVLQTADGVLEGGAQPLHGGSQLSGQRNSDEPHINTNKLELSNTVFVMLVMNATYIADNRTDFRLFFIYESDSSINPNN
jgi:hypothetical protein